MTTSTKKIGHFVKKGKGVKLHFNNNYQTKTSIMSKEQETEWLEKTKEFLRDTDRVAKVSHEKSNQTNFYTGRNVINVECCNSFCSGTSFRNG